MKHLLDYDILKEWGFAWATKKEYGDDDIVVSYLKAESFESDVHDFKSILLSLYPHSNFARYWMISYLGAKEKTDVLFRGRIEGKQDLECILKSCLIFKPREDFFKAHS